MANVVEVNGYGRRHHLQALTAAVLANPVIFEEILAVAQGISHKRLQSIWRLPCASLAIRSANLSGRPEQFIRTAEEPPAAQDDAGFHEHRDRHESGRVFGVRGNYGVPDVEPNERHVWTRFRAFNCHSGTLHCVNPEQDAPTPHDSVSFATLLMSRAPARAFATWFRSRRESRRVFPADWMEAVVPVANAVQDLHWMSGREKTCIQSCILHFVLRAFTEQWDPAEMSTASHLLKESLEPFMSWLQTSPDELVVEFCWDLLRHDRSFTPEPVLWLKGSGRLAGELSFGNIRLAVSTAGEGEAMFWWPDARWAFVPWDGHSRAYIEMLSHESYLVRAAAARTCGELFFGTITKSTGAVPSLREILALFQEHEAKTPGVAGPFLHGAHWDTDLAAWQSFARDVDMHQWFIATLRGSGQEPQVPHMLALEFYAHEFFSKDADAIRDFLNMGRERLAVMTATENPEPLPELLPLLNEMKSCSNPRISAAIRAYLSQPSHHSGLQHLEDADTNPF